MFEKSLHCYVLRVYLCLVAPQPGVQVVTARHMAIIVLIGTVCNLPTVPQLEKA